MGASIIQPVRDDPNKCVFTTIAHINPGEPPEQSGAPIVFFFLW